MKTTSAKLLGSVASSVLLVSAGAAAVVPAMNAAAGDNAVAYAATAEETSAIDAVAPVMKVQGDFSFTQTKITDAAEISGVFSKAVAALCASMPEYGVAAASGPITTTGGTTLQATVEEMQADEAAEAVIMACACASNIAGGGAMANADVSGVTLKTVAALAQAL